MQHCVRFLSHSTTTDNLLSPWGNWILVLLVLLAPRGGKMTSDGHGSGSGLSTEHVSQSIDWATLVVVNLYNCSFHSSGTFWFL